MMRQLQADRNVRTGRSAMWGAALLLAGLPLGCTNKPMVQPDIFVPESQVRDIDQAVTAQAVAGARADGTLYPQHFDGGQLNSLGQAKLQLMTADMPATRPVIVYIGLAGNDPAARDRRSAVQSYLQGFGLPVNRIELRDGPNPDSYGSAADNITRLQKLESTGTGYGKPMGSESTSGGK